MDSGDKPFFPVFFKEISSQGGLTPLNRAERSTESVALAGSVSPTQPPRLPPILGQGKTHGLLDLIQQEAPAHIPHWLPQTCPSAKWVFCPTGPQGE